MLNPYIAGTFRLYFQLQGTTCDGTVEATSRVVLIDDYELPTGKWQDVYIPLHKFASEEQLNRAFALVLEGIAPLEKPFFFESFSLLKPCSSSSGTCLG